MSPVSETYPQHEKRCFVSSKIDSSETLYTVYTTLYT